MPEFVYEALDPRNGKVVKDIGEFQDVRELFQWLKRQGFVLLRYRKRRFNWREKFFTKVSRRELAEFCRNLAFMIKGGVPLLPALSDLAKTTENPRLVKAIHRLIKNIESGKPFSESLKSGDMVFSPIVIALVQVGEESGRLDQTLEAAAEHLLRLDEIISNTKRALIYPVFLLGLISFAFAFWIFFVLPKILVLFQEMNISLPLPTRILIAVVSFFKTHWGLLFGFSLVLGCLLFLIFKSRKGRFLIEKISFRFPLVSRVQRLSMLAFFFEYTALLLEAGVDLLRSLEIMQQCLRRPTIDYLLQEIRQKIEGGFSLAVACEMTNFFTPLELRMLKVGEETGKLVEQLSYLADYYYKGLQNLVESLSKTLEPALIIVAGVIFLMIGVALIGPIYDLISQMGNM